MSSPGKTVLRSKDFPFQKSVVVGSLGSEKDRQQQQRLNAGLILKQAVLDDLYSIYNPQTSEAETAKGGQPKNVKSWCERGAALILTPRRSVRTGSERDGGREDSLGDV